MSALIIFEWDGESMVPQKRFQALCDREFVVHEVYRLEVREENSVRSRNHYFAQLETSWLNLPESCGLEPWAQTKDHLRAYALIKCGWYDSVTHVCSSGAEARRMAAFLRPLDEYSIVTAIGSTIVRYSAQSQSQKAMGRKRFQASKVAVLDFVASLVGVTAAQLKSESIPSR